jgi:hypothetical protein
MFEKHRITKEELIKIMKKVFIYLLLLLFFFFIIYLKINEKSYLLRPQCDVGVIITEELIKIMKKVLI